ncbi:MAG: ribose-phosphate diphosphokinase [Methanomicrobiales archaeon]|nr:ribose-phosphate diphosphokinase [Methanomicrobiales archaeon]
MKVAGTQRSQILASRIANSLGVGLLPVHYSRFPDGEHYLQTGPLDDQTVIIGTVTDSDSLVQLLLLIDACGTSENVLVLPYMGYARQDKQFREGEPVSARAVAQALSRGVNRVITVQIHDPAVLTHFGLPAENLTPVPEIHSFLSSAGYQDPLILAPDEGALGFALAIARKERWDCDHLEKTRLSGEEVRVEPKKLPVTARTVVIVDDIISTGGTLATAARMLYSQGAAEVHAVCVHGIFTGGAYTFLLNAGISDLVASDSIESGYSRYSVADSVARAIQNADH